MRQPSVTRFSELFVIVLQIFFYKYADRYHLLYFDHKCLIHPREGNRLPIQTQALHHLPARLRRVQGTPQVYKYRSPEMDILDIVKRNHFVMCVGYFIVINRLPRGRLARTANDQGSQGSSRR
jgi:hypothetical protein